MAQIPCPACGRLARIVQRFTLNSTDGPVEHVNLSCPEATCCRRPSATSGRAPFRRCPTLTRSRRSSPSNSAASPVTARWSSLATVARRAPIAFRRPVARPAVATGAHARGAAAIGALAVGSAAIGALAIGRLAVRRASIERLRIGELEVDRLIVRELRVERQVPLPPVG
jgi:hypothetical protein